MGAPAVQVLVNAVLAVIAVRAVLPLADKIVLEKAVHLGLPGAASSFFLRFHAYSRLGILWIHWF